MSQSYRYEMRKTDGTYPGDYGIYNDGSDGLRTKLLSGTSKTIVDSSGNVISQLDEATGKWTQNSHDAGATGVQRESYHNSASPAVDDVIDEHAIYGENDAGEKVQYATVQTQVKSVTDGAEEAWLKFQLMNAGTLDTDAFEMRIVSGAPKFYVGGSEVSGATPFGGARVYNATSITGISTSSPRGAALTFDSEKFDTDSYHDTGTNPSRLTAPSDGYYMVGGHVLWSSTGSGARLLTLHVNGTDDVCKQGLSTTAGSDDRAMSISTMLFLNSGDYIELFARSTVSSIDIDANGEWSPYFWIAKLGS